ncbi:MAG: hypothetical protein ACPHJ3_12260, partial [Rubripirellula sp.]
SGICWEQKVGRACRATSLTRKAHPDSCTKHYIGNTMHAVNGTALGQANACSLRRGFRIAQAAAFRV